MKVLKTGLGVLLLAAIVSGCSTTSDEEVASTPVPEDTSASTQPVDTTPVVEEEPEVVLDTIVYFDFDESVLKADTRALLIAHAEKLKASPAAMRLEGHADERGSREYNMALGERRANAVRDFLVLQGVDASLLETVSYGEESPAAYGSSESSYSQNRRVELN